MRNKRIKVLVIIMLMAISIMGCDNAKDYSGEYNLKQMISIHMQQVQYHGRNISQMVMGNTF